MNSGKTIELCETEIRLDYSQMNYAPEKQLRAYEFQHPTWFINHMKVSKNLHIIKRLSRYEEYREGIIDKLNAVAEMLEDRTFNKLVAAIDAETEDHGLEQVQEALSCVCENYRIERRVIRNRRQALVTGPEMAYHDLVAGTALMCQAELEAKAAHIIRKVPQTTANIRELTTANMLYLRRKILEQDE